MLELRNLGQSKPTGSRNEVRYNCPYCSDDKFHMYVNNRTGMFHCFKCGKSGLVNVLKFVVRETPQVVEEKQTELPTYPSIFGISNVQEDAIKYWYSRGFTKEEAVLYDLKVQEETKTIAIPVLDENGKLVFFQRRAIYPTLPYRYLFPKGVHVSEYLFNLFRAKEKEKICLVEGVFDAMAIGEMGVCLFGKQLHDVQIEKLRRTNVRKILLWLDIDAGSESFRAANKLMSFFDVEIVESRIKDAADFRLIMGQDALRVFLEKDGKVS